MSNKDLHQYPIPPPFAWVLPDESQGATPLGIPSSLMSTITLDSQLVDISVADGGNKTKPNHSASQNPGILQHQNQNNPSMAVPSAPTAPLQSERQTMINHGVHPVEKRGRMQDDDCSALAPLRPQRKPASILEEPQGIAKTLEDCTPMCAPEQQGIAKTLEDCTPMCSPNQSESLRSSTQPVLILEKQQRTSHTSLGTGVQPHGDVKLPKQPMQSMEARWTAGKTEVNQGNGNECHPSSFENQFADEDFEEVELDVEAPSVGDKGGVASNTGAADIEKEEVSQRTKTACLFVFFALTVASFPLYMLYFEQEGTKSSSHAPSQSSSPGHPGRTPTFTMRLEQIQHSFPDKFSVMGESMQWLLYEDTWIPPIGAQDYVSYWKERYALAELYHSTSGETWSFEHNWLSPDSVCDWSCCTPHIYSVTCDDTGRVTAISFGARFSRDYVNLEGTLPVDIFAGMMKLRHLNLDNNRFAGQLPRLPNSIEHFGISNNRFSGTIEKSHIESLSQLTYLNLSNNFLSGSLPRLPSNLVRFYAFQDPDKGTNHEGFSGSIPNDYFRSLTKLTTLNLHDNALVGSIPSLPPILRQLELHANHFTGLPELPPTVEEVLLHDNQIGGTIEADYFYSLVHIQRFFIARNRMRGPIPSLPPFLNYAWFQENCFTDVSNAARRSFNVTGNGEADYC